jgi:hypothetical protein
MPLLQQRFNRQISKLENRKKMLFEQWCKNKKEIQKKLYRFVDLSKWEKNNKHCYKLHKKMKYIFLDQSSIIKRIEKMLNKIST